MHSVARLVLAASLLQGCSTPQAPPPPAQPASVFTGDVIGPLATFRPDARVTLSWLPPSGAAPVLQDARDNTAFAGYRVVSRRTGRHRLSVSAAGAVPASMTVDVPAVGVELDHLFRLEAAGWRTVTGQLVDPTGAPLAAEDVAFLLPEAFGHEPDAVTEGADGVAEAFPFTGGSELRARHDAGGLPHGRWPALLDPETGAFLIDLPDGFHGRAELTFRGELVATADVALAGAEVTLIVPVAELRRKLGTIELTVAGDADGAPAGAMDLRMVRQAGDGPGADESLAPLVLAGAPGRLRLAGVPPGEYVVVATAAGAGSAAATLVVPAGEILTATLQLAPPAQARVTLRAPPEFAEHAADRLVLTTPDGVQLPARFALELESGLVRLILAEAPPGDVVFHAGSNVLRAVLGSGTNPDLEFPLAAEHTARVPVQLLRTPSQPRPESVQVRVRLTARDDTLIRDETWDVTLDPQGSGVVPLDFVPGRYLLQVDVPAARHTTAVEVVLSATDHGRTLLFDGAGHDLP